MALPKAFKKNHLYGLRVRERDRVNCIFRILICLGIGLVGMITHFSSSFAQTMIGEHRKKIQSRMTYKKKEKKKPCSDA